MRTSQAEAPNSASQSTQARWIDEANGVVSREIFVSDEIYQQELDRIFRRVWLYLGHESEVKNTGDVITRNLAGEPVVVTRGENGVIHAFLNSCSHRGVKVCRVDSGNVRRLVCPYHGWSFAIDGHLVSTGVDPLFPEGTDFSQMGLMKVPRVESYKGLIFASWNADVMPLEAYLGDFRWYLDLFVARTPGGSEVLAPPQRSIVPADWKTAAINFGTDNTHVLSTHIGPFTLANLAFTRQEIGQGLQSAVQISTPNGHSCSMVSIASEPWQHSPPDLRPLYEQTLSKDQCEVLQGLAITVGTVFPNLSFIENAPTEVMPGVFRKGLLLRQWQPLGAGRIEVLSWCIAEAEGSDEYKQEMLSRGITDFGIGGLFEQEDVELWTSIGASSKGPMAQSRPFIFQTALPQLNSPIESHAGPGEAYQPFAAEITQFKFLQHWNQLMTEEQR